MGSRKLHGLVMLWFAPPTSARVFAGSHQCIHRGPLWRYGPQLDRPRSRVAIEQHERAWVLVHVWRRPAAARDNVPRGILSAFIAAEIRTL